MKKTETLKMSSGIFFKSIIKGSLIALSISLVCICIFAFLLRFFDINTSFIKPINQIIKILSIVIGTVFSLKDLKEMGLITGFIIGVLYTLFAFFVFSLLNGSLSFTPSIINDLLFSGIAGSIAGVFVVNIFGKKNKQF